METKLLTLQEYANRHELTVRQIQNHIAAGLPHTRRKNRKGGRPRIFFDVIHADAWLSQKGIITKGMVATAAQKGKGLDVDAEAGGDNSPPVTGIDREMMKRFGLMGALERFRYLEAVASNRLTRLIINRSSPIEISTCQRHISAVVAQLRQLEMAALDYQEKAEQLLPAEQVTSAGMRIAERIRSSLSAVGHNCVPRLAQYMRNRDDFAAIQTIIDNGIRDALRNLPENVLKPT